jgi:hypothetical protein
VRLVTYRTLNTDGSAYITQAAFWASPNLPGFTLQPLTPHIAGHPNIAGIADQDAPFCG